jgi:plasmid maintenance system antidote protein VapI
MRKYTKADVLDELKHEVEKDNKSKVAASLGVTPQLISLILVGDRGISDALALRLGFIKLPDAYIRAPKQGKK